MTKAPKTPKRQLFRTAALAHYQGPSEHDIPAMLPRWRSVLPIMALLIAFGVLLMWTIL